MGINYRELLEMLCLIARPRLAELAHLLPGSLSTCPSSLSSIREAMAFCPAPTVFLRAGETPVADGLRDLPTLSSARGRTVEEHLSGELQQLLPAEGDRTLCLLRLFELQQISAVLSELLANPDLSTQ